MPAVREYLIRHDGGLIRRDTSEVELDLTDELIGRLATDRVIKTPQLWVINNRGPVHLAVQQGQYYFIVSLTHLIIRTHWALANNVLVPTFGNSGEALTVPWTPPSDCRLRLVVSGLYRDNSWRWSGSWLFALSPNSTTWRLPIANVHEDCSCCTGIDGGITPFPTAIQMAQWLVDNFDQSRYNRDLLRSSEVAQMFFRVEQKKDSFVTLPPTVSSGANWTELCLKVASALTPVVI